MRIFINKNYCNDENVQFDYFIQKQTQKINFAYHLAEIVYLFDKLTLIMI